MKTISAQENGTKFQEKIVSCVELNCRHQAKSIFVVNFLHISIYVDRQLFIWKHYFLQILIFRYKSNASELQFLHPVIAKIIGDPWKETQGASSRQSMQGEQKKSFFIFILRWYSIYVNIRVFHFVKHEIFQASFNLQVDPLKWGPDKIFFQTCDDLDELILVVRFILKHNLEVSGRLVATFYK